MELGHPPSHGDREQAHGYVADAVRQGVQLAKLDWDSGLSVEAIEEVDARIDRKIDKVKIWLAGIAVANLLPVIGFAYMFGQFTSRVETKLEGLKHVAPAAETDRRLNEVERRVGELEGFHREGGGR